MANEIIQSAPHKDFEGVKKIDDGGVEFWAARELMPLLGYTEWRNFEEVIGKAAQACFASGQNIDNHFVKSTKMVEIGSNTIRKVTDYKLDRYACYLIAQNGDPKKQEIAIAQTYFAIQTRRQEIFEQLPDTSKRLSLFVVRSLTTTKNFSEPQKPQGFLNSVYLTTLVIRGFMAHPYQR